MNEWQNRFTLKLETVRTATRDRFETIADETLTPIFDEFSNFARKHQFRATAPLGKTGIRTYKFALTENAYVLMTFRHAGFKQCDAETEFFVPGCDKLPSITKTAGLSEFDARWCRQIFEQALDRFLDSVTESLGELTDASTATLPA